MRSSLTIIFIIIKIIIITLPNMSNLTAIFLPDVLEAIF